MVDKLNFAIKIIIFLTLSVYVYLFDYDYKYSLFFLILAYAIGSFLLIPLLHHKFLKFFVYTLDLVMLTYFSYATGNVYFSLFYYLLLISENSFKHTFFLILISIPIVVYNFYQTNFYDFFYLSFVVGLNLFLLKNIFLYKDLNKVIQEKISIAQENYLNYIRCRSKSEFYKKYYEVSMTLNLFKKGKISPEFFGSFLYDLLNADCVIVYSTENEECYNYGCYIDCSIVKDKLFEDKLYTNEDINKALNFRYIFSKKIGSFRLILVYKEFLLEEDEIINIMMQ